VNSQNPQINADHYVSGVQRKTSTCPSLNRVEIKPRELGASVRSVEAFTVKKRENIGFESFKAIAHIFRDRESNKAPARIAKTLMDPGAEINLIQASLINTSGRDTRLKIHAREACSVELFNNGKTIGSCNEAVYLSFALERPDGKHDTYHEWLYVWKNMKEEEDDFVPIMKYEL
jgi:hypothetical protein